MGLEDFPAVPTLVDRSEELNRIQKALASAGKAASSLLLIRGEAGSGKTRLIREVAKQAEGLGRTVLFGTARAEAAAPYGVWNAPLDESGMRYLLEDARPPRLMGLYLLPAKRQGSIRVEREPVRESGQSSPAKPSGSAGDRPGRTLPGGGISTSDRGDDSREVVLERPDFLLRARVKGREDEIFIEDLRRLADSVEFTPTGVARKTLQSFQNLMDSGKYEGIDYGKDDPKVRQSRLFQNVTLGFARVAVTHPLLIVLDDLQWTDPSSLALLGYVARNLRQSNALLIGAYRTEEGGVRPQLREALDRMAKEGLQDELALGGLSRRDAGALAQAFVGRHELPESFLDLLWNETGGNPLIVREVLRGLEEEGSIQLRGTSKKLVSRLEDLSIPRRVREALRARLDRIPKEDRRLLEAAAACGTRFTAAMVARLVGEAEGRVLNGFGAIAGVHGFLHGGKSGFSFDHPAVQEVLHEGMAEDVRRVYHREAADWLDLAGGPTEEVAEHLYLAGDLRAVGRLRQAARTGRERYANAEAIRFCTEALELEGDAATRREILEDLSSLQVLVGDFKGGLASLAGAEPLAKTRRERAGILGNVGEIHIGMGEFERANRALAEALALVEGEGGTVEASILLAAGTERWKTGDFDRSLDYLGRGMAAWEKAGDRRGVAKTLYRIGIVRYEKGETTRGLEDLGRSLDIRREIGDAVGVAGSLNALGILLCERGDYGRGLEYLSQSLSAWEKIGDPKGMAGPLINLGNVHRRLGEHEQAIERIKQGLAIAKRIGDQDGVAAALLNLGIVQDMKGDSQQSRESFDQSATIFEKTGNRVGLADALNNLGNVLRESGDYEGAYVRLGRSLAIHEQTGDPEGMASALVSLAELALEEGDLSRAEGYCERGLSVATESGTKSIIAEAKMAFGILYRKRRAWRESSECFEESLRISAQVGQPFLQGWAHREFGLMRRDAGDAADARVHLDSAGRIFEKLKLPNELRKVTEARRGLP